MEFFFSRDPENPPSPADKQPGSDRNPSPSDFSASSFGPPASSDELSAAPPDSSPSSTNGLRAAAQNDRGAASAEQEDAPRFLHPFTRYYASIIEREGDPVAGVADRKQKALDDAARFGGLLQAWAKPVAYSAQPTPRPQNGDDPAPGQQPRPQTAPESNAPFAIPARPEGASPPTVQRGFAIGGRDEDSPTYSRNVEFQEDRTDQVRGRNWRYLTDAEKTALRPYFTDEHLNEVKLHVGERSWMQPKDNAITLENHIYWVNDQQPDLSNPEELGLLAHEVQHTKQFREGLTQGEYVWESIQQALRNGSFQAGYSKNWSELNANKLRKNVEQHPTKPAPPQEGTLYE